MPIQKLATSLAANYFDDQTATYTPDPTNAQGVKEAFATGTAPVYVAVPGTAVALVPATDGSGSLVMNGVTGQAGVEVITGNYTNPDGTPADPVTITLTMSVDPAEADVATLGGTISTPTPINPVAAKSAKRP